MRRAWLQCSFAAGLVLAIPSLAHACTCQDRSVGSPGSGTPAEQSKARFDRAGLVLKGHVISVTAGRDVVWPQSVKLGDGVTSMTATTPRVISAQFEVVKALKGDVTGTVVVLTGPGFGECGIGGVLIGAALVDRDISLELTPVDAAPGHYSADMCGYLKFDTQASSSSKAK